MAHYHELMEISQVISLFTYLYANEISLQVRVRELPHKTPVFYRPHSTAKQGDNALCSIPLATINISTHIQIYASDRRMFGRQIYPNI